MNETDMKKRLKKLAVFTIGMLLILLAAGLAVTHVFFQTFMDATGERMREEANNYEGYIERQIDRNFQLLNSVASMIGNFHQEDQKILEASLKEINEQNDFLTFGYFDRQGNGYFSEETEEELIERTLENTQRQIQEAVSRSFLGEEVITDTFTEQLSLRKVFLFSVPVYDDGEIIGVLTASDPVDIFSNILDDKNIFYGSGFIHLVDSRGNYLIRGREMAVKENVSSIMGPPYLSEKKAEKVQSAMERSEEVEFEFVYGQQEFHALLEPINVNGWYLFCVNSVENVNRNIYSVAHVVGIFFVIIIGLFLFTMYAGYKTVKRMNYTLRKTAYYDDLTGIYNIPHFMELAEEISGERKEYAIAVLNVRQFKFINEIFGKKQADRLLQYLGKMLETEADADAGEFACRESADSFYLFLKQTDKESLERRMQDFIDRVTAVDSSKRGNYQLVIRCGIAVADPGEEISSVMTRAMFALAKTKEDRHRNLWFFDSALHEQEQMNNFMESNAREALRNEEFQLYLQPKINLQDGSLEGAEALVRWVRNDGMILYPNTFIPLFEESGLCSGLDMYMFEKVCQQIHFWESHGYAVVPISINQSRMTFYEENYEERLCACLEKYGVSASMITLEILEGMILEDVGTLNTRLESLRKIGFKISMDDFGTGYSSLNVLGRLKLDEVKLDRGFLLEAYEGNNENTKLIMEEIVRLSQKLHISTVIEGIETEESEQFVKAIGCDKGQGYLYSRPVNAKQFTEEILERAGKRNYTD